MQITQKRKYDKVSGTGELATADDEPDEVSSFRFQCNGDTIATGFIHIRVRRCNALLREFH